MATHASRAVLAAVFASCCAGCSYVHDRTNDLLDPFRVDVGFGPGLFVDVRATDFLEVGAGIHIVETAGMHGRFVGTGTMAGIGLPFATFVQMRQRMAPLLGDASSFDRMRDVVPGQVLVVVPMMHSPRISAWSLAERDVRIADLGVTATVGLVSVSLGFSPGEVLDLLLGFVGIDLAGDDVADKPRRDASEMTELPVYDVQSLPATPR